MAQASGLASPRPSTPARTQETALSQAVTLFATSSLLPAAALRGHRVVCSGSFRALPVGVGPLPAAPALRRPRRRLARRRPLRRRAPGRRSSPSPPSRSAASPAPAPLAQLFSVGLRRAVRRRWRRRAHGLLGDVAVGVGEHFLHHPDAQAAASKPSPGRPRERRRTTALNSSTRPTAARAVPQEGRIRGRRTPASPPPPPWSSCCSAPAGVLSRAAHV